MVKKTLFKMDNDPLISSYGTLAHEEVVKQEVYSIKDNKMVVRRILETGMNFTESPFERQDAEVVILSDIEIQFALYPFYMIYDDREYHELHFKPKYVGELNFPNEENQLNDEILARLLSIFDSIRVAYQQGKSHVQITLSSTDSITGIYNIYQKLNEESRLNPFILSLLSKGKGRHSEDTPYVAYQYQPAEAELIEIEANEEERIFIDFVQQQLELSPYFLFYCVGWSEEDITESKELKKLAKYFKKICFLSTPDPFLSQMMIIYN
ncbi:hypothetical protein [Paenibacillus jiagnxiensis]|uniref:hypothetical protein n=1 Tax=Paenibacillus jiagnxiensis TaxID=3228926 RepID=UPI0033B84CC4